MFRIKTAIRGVGLATFILFVLFVSPLTTAIVVLLKAMCDGADVATIALPVLVSEYGWRIVADIITVCVVLKYGIPESELRKRKEE